MRWVLIDIQSPALKDAKISGDGVLITDKINVNIIKISSQDAFDLQNIV